MTITNNNENDDEDIDATSSMRQKLMSAEEVYVYKIPPLKTAGGHRAEDWNLANPLKTCHLHVERRGDLLVLDFTAIDSQTLFCQSIVDLRAPSSSSSPSTATTTAPPSSSSPPPPPPSLEQFVESAVDTSRYFVIKIQGANNRQAHIGFGFRERDQAIDFRESLQYYDKAMRREREAAAASAAASATLTTANLDGEDIGRESATTSKSESGGGFHVPKLAEGEKIHVNLGSGKKSTIKVKSSSSNNQSADSSSSSSESRVPLLKKKPPPAAQSSSSNTTTTLPPPLTLSPKSSDPTPVIKTPPSAAAMAKMNISLGNIDLDDAHNTNNDDDDDPTDSSGCAVYDGDDDQWATEFTSA